MGVEEIEELGPFGKFLLGLTELEERHEKEQFSYLREGLEKQGWMYTSENPGNSWMWEKRMPDGRVLVVDSVTALYLEGFICGEDIG